MDRDYSFYATVRAAEYLYSESEKRNAKNRLFSGFYLALKLCSGYGM